MTKGKWYSPQLSREVVRRLYFRAKAERVPMTVLADRIIGKILDMEGVVQCDLSPDATSAVATASRVLAKAPGGQTANGSRVKSAAIALR